MYEEYYAKLPDTEAYLRRIGLEMFGLKPDLESLDRLIHAHLTQVPFENMDSWMGICPDLRISSIFDKVVTRHRGGYCFELNSLFNALLRALGFETYMVSSFVMGGRTELHPPAHCSIVCIIDGEKYFCDVGYGGPVPGGGLNFNGESRLGFHIEKDEGPYTHLFNELSGHVEITFRDSPVSAVEFIPNNYYVSQIPESAFRNQLHLNQRLDGGSITVIENELKYRNGPERYEKFFELAELPGILEEYFNIPATGIPMREFGPAFPEE